MMENNELNKKYGDNLKKEEPRIISGAKKGDLDEVKAAVQENPDCINAVSQFHETALIIAASEGMYSIVDFLCDQPGIDVSATDMRGRPAYLIAQIIGRDDIHDRIMRNTMEECNRMADIDDADNVETLRPKPPSGPS